MLLWRAEILTAARYIMPQYSGSATMYTLYGSPGAASLAVHWLLIEVGGPFEYVRIDTAAKQQKEPWYLELNPNGVVPTLMVDGEPRYECAALLLILAERHPHAHFLPPAATSEAGLYYQWMLHCANTLQPAFRHWFYPAEAAEEANIGAAQESARMRIEAAWDQVDAQLSRTQDYIVGATVTAVDFLATMLMRWSRNMPKPAASWPGIAEYIARMKSRPSFAELYRREGLTDWT
jgi:glutathione S-transferase